MHRSQNVDVVTDRKFSPSFEIANMIFNFQANNQRIDIPTMAKWDTGMHPVLLVLVSDNNAWHVYEINDIAESL